MRVTGLKDIRTVAAVFLASAILLLTGCGGGDAGSGFVTGSGDYEPSCSSPFAGPGCDPSQGGGTVGILPTCNSDETGIIDACGVVATAVDLHDPVAMSVTGLTANTRHTIVITDPLTAEITPTGGLTAISDGDGAINKAVIVQNMSAAAELGAYTVTVAVEGGATAQTLNYTVENRSRVQCVDNAGSPQASFLAGGTVFAKVDKNDGSLADGTFDVYVMSDSEKALADGGLIGGTPLSVNVASGTGTVSLGSSYTVGAYDVLVDVNGNGIFNQGTDLISRHNRLLPCFAVQAVSGSAIQQIASDKNGNKREIFDPNANIAAIRDIQAFVTPTERSGLQNPGSVRTYLVAHQDAWANNDALVGVAAGAGDDYKVSPVQNDSNSEAPWILAPYAGLTALGGTTCYDVVVDTNGNGRFDVGTDYVDNEDHLRNNACGVRVSTASCANVAITSHTDGETLTDTAITLAGTIAGSPTSAYVTITGGEQSNTIAIAGGAYSLNVPLFAGDNHITVSGIYADNSSCSETVTITSLTDLALFRAQLTWDGSTDMDLHVVRVSGGTGYSNGGGGADDCNYSNCNVGLSGAGSNGISWGTGGEEDDPKLDVDCISCGNGIENIWMNQITEDGRYEVYVDAYSGSEIDVTVTISILGTAVGQVNCGSMASGTATDSCFVGTINWVGGTSGIGSFTPDGTKAADF